MNETVIVMLVTAVVIILGGWLGYIIYKPENKK